MVNFWFACPVNDSPEPFHYVVGMPPVPTSLAPGEPVGEGIQSRPALLQATGGVRGDVEVVGRVGEVFRILLLSWGELLTLWTIDLNAPCDNRRKQSTSAIIPKLNLLL